MHKVFYSKKFWLSIGLFLYIFSFFLRQTNLAASDLGRHIKNGEVITQTGTVFHTNLYSYTHPEFAAPNHHWLFGVISYRIHQITGFAGLTLMGAILYTGAIALVYWYSVKKSSVYAALAAAFVLLPLLADRSETRPEAFSSFFFAVVFCSLGWILDQKKIEKKWLIRTGAVALMAAWINIHIFFVLTGVLGIAAFLHAFFNKLKPALTEITIIGIAFVIGAFINPLGSKLILYPLEIFNNYGYRVSENQPLWFFLQHYTRPIHWYLTIVIGVTIWAVWYWTKKKPVAHLYYILSTMVFLGFSIKLMRMENIFALTAFPVLSSAFAQLEQKHGATVRKKLSTTLGMMVSSTVGLILLALMIISGLFSPFHPAFGVGLTPGYDYTIQALRELNLQGRIFNNFDSGSFLIYALYPEKQVFVDNRAEAYPSKFFQESYVAAQEDDVIWRNLQNTYAFSSIIFYRHEQTNWGQEFLVKRLEDPEWIPIYVDGYLIIFVRDTEANQDLIEKYRLPDEIFTVVPG